jgi:hypothetical protein
MFEDFERLYDELSGHREEPPQSNEYDPYGPLGLSSQGAVHHGDTG